MATFAILSAQINLLAEGVYFPAEDHRLTASKTSYPVESGKSLSDNLVREPEQLTLEGLVSDVTPGVTTGDAGVVWDRISQLVGGSLVTVVTHIRTYTNMAVVKAETRRDNGIRGGLDFRLEMEEILFATSVAIRLTDVLVDAGGPAADRTAAVSGGTKLAPVITGPRFSQNPGIELTAEGGVVFR